MGNGNENVCTGLGQHQVRAEVSAVTTGGDKAVNKEELGKGQQQVAESRTRLLKLKADRDLDVSAVRISGDERESQRRTKEEEQRQVSISALDFVQRRCLQHCCLHWLSPLAVCWLPICCALDLLQNKRVSPRCVTWLCSTVQKRAYTACTL